MLKHLKAAALGSTALLGLICAAGPASAQNAILNPACNGGQGGIVGVTYGAVQCQMPVNASVTASASITPFAPAGVYAQISNVTTTSSRVALPGSATIVVYNTGSSAVSVTLGNSTVVATATEDTIQPSSWMAYAVGANTNLAAITATGTSSIVISAGTGMPAGSGGGGGGTGSGAIGSTSDAIFGTNCTYSGTTAATLICEMAAVYNAIIAPPPPSNVHIGNVDGFETQGAAVAGGLFREGCRAATALPSAVADGQAVDAMCGKDGKQVVVMLAPEEMRLRGYGETTGTSLATLISAQGAGVKILIAQAQCWNSGTAALTVQWNDSVSTKLFLPAGGANNPNYTAVPLVVAANTALSGTLSAAPTGGTVGCAVQGGQGN